MEIKTFSPKELADVVGVSESSIKRWGDAGLIEVIRTAGGHRRIVMSEALRFIRRQGLRILRPDLLGLPDLEGLSPEAREGTLAAETLFEVLHRGEAARARGLIAMAYLNGAGLPSLCDGPVAGALARFGTLWQEDDRGIYLEHVATNVCIEALNQIHALLPSPEAGAPVALGGAPEDDPYVLPSLMAACVLADAGYRAVNVGAYTPVSAFRHAAADSRPSLVWISATVLLTEEKRKVLIRDLALPLLQQSVDVVVGGQGAGLQRDAWPPSVRLLRSMEELAAFAKATLTEAP